MSTDRSTITGVSKRVKTSIDDFDQHDKTELAILLSKYADTLLSVARVLSASVAKNTTIVLKETNPNLFITAAMYYGDVRKYEEIRRNSRLALAVLNGTGNIEDDYVVLVPKGL